MIHRFIAIFVAASVLAIPLSRAQDQAALAVSTAPADAWLDTLTLELAAHFRTDGDLALEWARPRPVAPADAPLSVVEYPSALASQMLVRVRLTPADQPAVEAALFVRAQLWRDGWTPREPSARGETVRAESLDLKRFDVLRDRDGVPADPALDLVFARSLPAGRLLTWRDVTRRPLVRRGELIEVAASDGPLTVTLRAVAMADAGRGELVRVRNPESKKEFTAQVIAESRALVRF
ncbi:MAG TPA: flagellar basal body P-ring formation chaperone FlgA [Opitutaceae bacterium]